MSKRMICVLIIAIIITTITASIVINYKSKQTNNKNNYEKPNLKYEDGKFNINLIKTVNIDKKDNYLISPYSIELALNLLKAGADGETLNEIENVIGTRNINNVIIKDRISVANAAFIKNKYKDIVKKDYSNILKDKYNSEILYDEFKTPKIINDWVNNKTNGMIDKILDSVDSNFALGLANALAIDVEWDSPFDCSGTRSEKFTKDDGKVISVEMMHKKFTYNGIKYLKNDNANGIIIPYKMYNPTDGKVDYVKGTNLEFIAILPNKDVYSYINNITTEELDNLEKNAKEPNENLEINLAIPRFKYDYTLDNFKEVLKQMGINLAFDDDLADFTKIMDRSNEYGNLFVGDAFHKTHIELNEKGTKAAAVTYFGMYTNSSMPKEKEKINITFDKPFIYIIRDVKTKEMLFFGTVYEPNKWSGSTCSSDN